MDESSAEVKPKIEQGDDGTLSIKVRDQQNGEVVFKVKRSTRFKRVLDAFCNKKSWDSAQVRFAYEGQRVQEDMTPDDLGMENNDVRVSFLCDCIDMFGMTNILCMIYILYRSALMPFWNRLAVALVHEHGDFFSFEQGGIV